MASTETQPSNARQPTAAQPAPTTQRGRAKENRRQALLAAAASLFALNGFNRVSLEDLGAAAGVSGPAVYRHFSGKQAVLADLLVTVSQELLDGGRQVAENTADPFSALRRLVEFQVDFALGKPDVIRVQDRDFSNLSERDQLAVRTLQRSYVEVWVEEEFKAPIRRQYEEQGSPYYSTARLWDDGVIDPADTRTILGLALDVVSRTPLPETSFGLFRM